jgi:hypothetical protein
MAEIKTYYEMETNKEYIFDINTKEWKIKAQIQDIFDEMKKNEK